MYLVALISHYCTLSWDGSCEGKVKLIRISLECYCFWWCCLTENNTKFGGKGQRGIFFLILMASRVKAFSILFFVGESLAILSSS